MKMLEKLNELNGEIVRRLNERNFKVEDPRITKRDDMTTLRCDIVIDDMRFYAYTDDDTKGFSAYCANINTPTISDEDKKGLIQYLWMESARILTEQHKNDLETLKDIVQKIV